MGKLKVILNIECGTVIAVSDGKTINFNVEPGDYLSRSEIKR
nr:hypothetical protein [Thermoanaerobacter sp. YS13]